MSADKYPSIFSPQMEAMVFIILQIFYATRAVLKIGAYSRIFPSFSWGIFTHVTRLDQSQLVAHSFPRATLSENCSLLGTDNVQGQISELIIHQIFSLAHDWSKRVTWANIPQLKLGNIRGYSPIFKTARVA